MKLTARRVLIGLLGLALVGLAAVPVHADTNLFEIEGTLFVQGNNTCGGPCVQALSFSLSAEYVPFVPVTGTNGDDPTWTHRLVIHGSNDVISAGPLGTFTTPGETDPLHFKDLNEPQLFLSFFNSLSGAASPDMLSLVHKGQWWTSTPWVAPDLGGFAQLNCATPECVAAFGSHQRTGPATVIVRKVPEPLPLVLIVLGIAAMGATRPWRSNPRLGVGIVGRIARHVSQPLRSIPMHTLALSLLALALAVLPAQADTVYEYEYTGNPFTTWTGDTCLGDCAITAAFTLPTPLAANMPPSTVVGVFPLVQFVSDGYTTLRLRRGEAYIYSTDAQGLPLEWNVWQEYEPGISYELSTIRCSVDAAECNTDFVKIGDNRRGTAGLIYFASNQGAPGTWRLVTVPEPTTILLLGVGFAGIIGARSWRRAVQ